MIKEIHFVKHRCETQRGVQLKDGRIVSLYDEDNKLYLHFGNVLDLENGTFDDDTLAYKGDEGYEKSLNGMIESGLAEKEEVQCYDMVEFFEGVYPDNIKLTKNKINEIVKYFKEKGYNVSHYAIEHNILAWFADEKSGYRDETNGYHLFTPCGCNPLSIRLTTLHPLCEDWQQTYVC